MPGPSTTATDDLNQADATDSTTSTDSTATDNQTASTGDDLKGASQSTDTTSAEGDKTSTDDSAAKDTPASTFDTDLDEWIDKRGLPKPENDEQKQKYQDLRNDRREFTREQQGKKGAEELSKTVQDSQADLPQVDEDELDPLEIRQNRIEAELAAERMTRQQSEFYRENEITTEQHSKILEVLKEKLARPITPEAKKAAIDFWGSPDALPDLLDLAKARLASSVDAAQISDEAARQERERIAQESQANSTGRNARDTETKSKTAADERTQRLIERYS